jgi:hypothetical protein
MKQITSNQAEEGNEPTQAWLRVEPRDPDFQGRNVGDAIGSWVRECALMQSEKSA